MMTSRRERDCQFFAAVYALTMRFRRNRRQLASSPNWLRAYDAISEKSPTVGQFSELATCLRCDFGEIADCRPVLRSWLRTYNPISSKSSTVVTFVFWAMLSPRGKCNMKRNWLCRLVRDFDRVPLGHTITHMRCNHG